MDCLCTISEPTRTQQPGAVTSVAFVDAVFDVPCRLSLATGVTELFTADQLRTMARWNVTLPLGTAVTEKSRLVITGTDIDGNDFSVTLDVAGLNAPKSFAVHIKLLATMVRPLGT